MHEEDKPKTALDLIKYYNQHGRLPEGSEGLMQEIRDRNDALREKQLLKRQAEEFKANQLEYAVDELFEHPTINTVDEFLQDLFQ
jgi:hypothetical protein